MKVFKALIAFVALGVSASAFSSELLVTQGDSNAKSGQRSVSIDIVSDGNVSGFNFFVRTGQLKLGSVDLSSCVEALPKNFDGECRQGLEGVYFYAIAKGREALPAGVNPVGKLRLPAGVEVVGIEELAMGDIEGNTINASPRLAK